MNSFSVTLSSGNTQIVKGQTIDCTEAGLIKIVDAAGTLVAVFVTTPGLSVINTTNVPTS